MSTDPQAAPRPLPDRPNLRHLKDQAKDLVKAGTANSITDAQFKIARLYGFASWPKLKAHIDSLEEIGQLRQAIDANDVDRVKTMMTRNPTLHGAPLDHGVNPNCRDHGFKVGDHPYPGTALDYTVASYARSPQRLSSCIDILLEAGGVTKYAVPGVLQVLRGRLDSLAELIDADRTLV